MSVDIEKPVKSYIGDDLIWVDSSTEVVIPDKAFYADFELGRYVKDGKACAFEDLFEFYRSGNAWLVKDKDLVIYEADTPRFDNGLLIEEDSTTLIDSQIQSSRGNRGATRTPNGQFMRYTKGDGDGLIYSYPPYPVFEDVIHHVWIKSPKTGRVSLTSGIAGGSSYEYLEPESLAHIERQFNSNRAGRSHLGVSQGDLDPIDILHIQLEAGTYASTPIVGESSSTTRPADYLTASVTGTQIIGEWDDTLELSIEDGQIVHSGYGRIRTLEVV